MSNATRTNIAAIPNDARQGIAMVEPVFLSRDTLAMGHVAAMAVRSDATG